MNITNTEQMDTISTTLYLNKQKATEIHYTFYIVIVSIIVFGGTIGNIISFCFYSFRPRLRSQPVSVFVCGLAVLDTLVLWIANTPDWSLKVFKEPLPVVGSLCNVNWFLSSALPAAAAWISVVMTCDRIIAVFMPLQYKVTF